MAVADFDDIWRDHVATLRERFPGLRPGSGRGSEDRVVSGTLGFCATYVGQAVRTEYEVAICAANGYPVTVPWVFETAGRIPHGFHKMDDESLCLGTPLEVRLKFAKGPTLVDFVQHQLIPYLFCHACWEQSGKMPFGDRSRGGAGLLESYRELFGVADDLAVLHLLRVLAEGNYLGHTLCPCGSKLKGSWVYEISAWFNPITFPRGV
jgi:hypothetical protein